MHVIWAWNNRIPAWPVNFSNSRWYRSHMVGDLGFAEVQLRSGACAGWCMAFQGLLGGGRGWSGNSPIAFFVVLSFSCGNVFERDWCGENGALVFTCPPHALGQWSSCSGEGTPASKGGMAWGDPLLALVHPWCLGHSAAAVRKWILHQRNVLPRVDHPWGLCGLHHEAEGNRCPPPLPSSSCCSGDVITTRSKALGTLGGIRHQCVEGMAVT